MNVDQIAIVIILLSAMAMFVWNRYRYDVVAGIALMASVYVGLIPADHAFEGFSHPAVITVAAVLVISQALQSSGVVELFLSVLSRARGSLSRQLAANCGITMLLSAFMNNIGALALMLPITLRDAARAKRSPALLLMPLSFASLLGGLITAIGTPPNIVIATFRQDQQGEAFRLFDFLPVGLGVAFAGFLFLVFASRWFLSAGSEASERTAGDDVEDFKLARYLTEVRVPETSTLVGETVATLETMCDGEVSVMAILRRDRRRLAPSRLEVLQPADVLILEGESESLQPLFVDPNLLETGAEDVDPDTLRSPDVRVIEAVVMPNSALEGLSARSVDMHRRFGVNLLGVAREGRASRARLKLVRFRVGDVLLLQGDNAVLAEACQSLGCLAIKDRGLMISRRRGAFFIPGVFAGGIAAAGLGLVPIHIAFTTVVGVLVLARMISLRDAYRSIEWPVIVLLGFLIPVGEALQTTGTTDLIANGILNLSDQLPVWALLALIMAASMLLSDLVHNTPTAVLMAPIAYSLAVGLQLSPDAFLMAVAIGAASPYLTPIGHQSNTLVMGPGGYSFGSYWRLGLPLDIVILSVGVPLVSLIWL